MVNFHNYCCLQYSKSGRQSGAAISVHIKNLRTARSEVIPRSKTRCSMSREILKRKACKYDLVKIVYANYFVSDLFLCLFARLETNIRHIPGWPVVVSRCLVGKTGTRTLQGHLKMLIETYFNIPNLSDNKYWEVFSIPLSIAQNTFLYFRNLKKKFDVLVSPSKSLETLHCRHIAVALDIWRLFSAWIALKHRTPYFVIVGQ